MFFQNIEVGIYLNQDIILCFSANFHLYSIIFLLFVGCLVAHFCLCQFRSYTFRGPLKAQASPKKGVISSIGKRRPVGHRMF